jgi:hypothetical protein
MTPTEELTNEHRIILTVSDERKREVGTIFRTGAGAHEKYHELAEELAKN